MAVDVVPYRAEWVVQLEGVAADLLEALSAVKEARIEHVGSTSVPGLAAKPILDVDVIVPPEQVAAAVSALEAVGYAHVGDYGLAGREALGAPDEEPARHVYVCASGTLHVRNHLAVRDILRRRADLRDAYAAVKDALAADPDMDIDTYTVGKSDVLQRVLALADLTPDERRLILELNAAG
ncbi:hypothetical protein AX769_13550 [Frondihabitans sp. PAMC 28766]|uniref:GrpB family protein n=1 Tax=Frondihabitans sp. PAMC 28766 TaxID=1795630 RepID=UPI00078E0051|nr:GrpB family protein [Frondihabitans sp. PAMC 28766]AMM20970.1 hypothetical protein AX769_13550 [Frondihabitans sp. PAMC 28766]